MLYGGGVSDPGIESTGELATVGLEKVILIGLQPL